MESFWCSVPGAACFALTYNAVLTLLNRFSVSINVIFISNLAGESRVERHEIKMLHKTLENHALKSRKRKPLIGGAHLSLL